MLHAQVDSTTSIVDCVAGCIVGTRDIVLGAEPTRERCCHEEIRTRDYEIATCTKTIRFLNSPHTSAWEKRIGQEKYTRQSNVTWSLIYFSRNTWLCFAYESKNNGGFHRRYTCSIVAALLWTQGVIVSWLTSIGMFSLFAAFEGADSQKFNDFSGVEQSLNKFFLTWGLLSSKDIRVDNRRRRLILTCVSCNPKNRLELPHFFLGRSKWTGQVQSCWIFSYHKTDKLHLIKH